VVRHLLRAAPAGGDDTGLAIDYAIKAADRAATQGDTQAARALLEQARRACDFGALDRKGDVERALARVRSEPRR